MEPAVSKARSLQEVAAFGNTDCHAAVAHYGKMFTWKLSMAN